MKRKDLAEWEREYGGTTAEGIAKRVINQYNPSSEELSRVVNRGRCAGKKADGTTEGNEEMSSDPVSKNGVEQERPESEFLPWINLMNNMLSSCVLEYGFWSTFSPAFH